MNSTPINQERLDILYNIAETGRIPRKRAHISECAKMRKEGLVVKRTNQHSYYLTPEGTDLFYKCFGSKS